MNERSNEWLDVDSIWRILSGEEEDEAKLKELKKESLADK